MARNVAIPEVTFPHTVEKSGLFLGEAPPYITFTCIECGEPARDSFSDDYRIPIRENQWCFTCTFWHKKVDAFKAKPGRATIIGHYFYSPGDRTEGEMRGMAGRRFDIEYITGEHAGKKITCKDLWGGGAIPERFWNELPDNAVFLNGAEKVQVGDVGCFNPSDRNLPEYPHPRSIFGP